MTEQADVFNSPKHLMREQRKATGVMKELSTGVKKRKSLINYESRCILKKESDLSLKPHAFKNKNFEMRELTAA